MPQRDLAELLCFALTPESSDEQIHHYVELHRVALQRSIGGSLDRQAWYRGFQLAMRDLLVTRLPLYCLVHRVRPRLFLERVARTWRRLASAGSSVGGRYEPSCTLYCSRPKNVIRADSESDTPGSAL